MAPQHYFNDPRTVIGRERTRARVAVCINMCVYMCALTYIHTAYYRPPTQVCMTLGEVKKQYGKTLFESICTHKYNQTHLVGVEEKPQTHNSHPFLRTQLSIPFERRQCDHALLFQLPCNLSNLYTRGNLSM